MPSARQPERFAGRHVLVSHSAYIFLIRFFPALASLVVLLLFARMLPAGVYGHYYNFWIQWSVLHAIACLGLPAFLLTYASPVLHQFVRRLGRKGAVALTVWVVLLGIAFLLLQRDNDLFPVWLPGVYLPVYAGVAILESYLMLERQFRYLSVLNLVYALFFGGIHWLVLRQALSFPQLFLLLLAAGGCRLLLLLGPAYRKFRTTPQEPVVAAGSMGRLWMHLGLYDVSQVLFRWLDKFVVSLLLAPALSAVYAIGTMDIPFLPLLLGAVGGAILLHLGGREETDGERIRLVRYSSARLAGIVFPLFFFLLAFRYELFHVVFSGKYDAAVPLFLISILVVPLRAYNFTALLQHKGAGGLINKGALIDLVLALGLMYPLYRLLGMQGIALSFVISTWFQASYYLYHTARLMRCPMLELIPWRHWLQRLILFSTCFIGLHYILTLFCDPLITLILGGSIWILIMAWTLIPLLLAKRSAHGQAPQGI